MTEKQAKDVARALSLRGGDVGFEQTGGDVWVVTIAKGRKGVRDPVVVITDEVVSEYKTRQAWDDGLPPVKRIDLVNYGRHLG